MNNTMHRNDEARHEIDDLLHDYFQAEAPRSWPAFQAPKTMRIKQPASLWSRSAGRLALAACIGLLVAGYLALGGFFPRSQAPNGVQPLHEMGKGFDKARKAATPNNQSVDPMPMPIE